MCVSGWVRMYRWEPAPSCWGAHLCTLLDLWGRVRPSSTSHLEAGKPRSAICLLKPWEYFRTRVGNFSQPSLCLSRCQWCFPRAILALAGVQFQEPGVGLLKIIDLKAGPTSIFHLMLTVSVTRPGLLLALMDATPASTAFYHSQWGFLPTLLQPLLVLWQSAKLYS
jgi:hypothetical protein